MRTLFRSRGTPNDRSATRADRPVEAEGQVVRPKQRALRVAFFAMAPDDKIATWTFCRWPVDHSSQLGIEGHYFGPSGPALYRRMNRSGGRFKIIRRGLYWYGCVFPRRLWQLARARKFDVVLIQRGLLYPTSAPILEKMVYRFGPPIVYHLDDALWVLSPGQYRERVQLAARVVTGNALVEGYATRSGVPVSKVEYPVETDKYSFRRHSSKGAVVVGWTGARAEQYLPTAGRGILDACRRSGARLKVIGGTARPALGELDEVTDWEPWRPDRRFSALDDFDIGILPLEEDTELHEGKEPFKLKEYMACGIPVVASPVGHNLSVMSHGKEGFFASSDDEWAAMLLQLIDDPNLRAELGANGRRLVEARYDSWTQMSNLVRVLRESAKSSRRRETN